MRIKRFLRASLLALAGLAAIPAQTSWAQPVVSAPDRHQAAAQARAYGNIIKKKLNPGEVEPPPPMPDDPVPGTPNGTPAGTPGGPGGQAGQNGSAAGGTSTSAKSTGAAPTGVATHKLPNDAWLWLTALVLLCVGALWAAAELTRREWRTAEKRRTQF